jgi:serine/threonine-protein kinase
MGESNVNSVLQYRLVEELARDEHLVVYKALDTALQRAVTLKLFGSQDGEKPEFIWQYLPDLEKARRLEHRNVARLHDVLEYEGRILIIADYFEAQPFEDILAAGPMHAQEFLDWAVALADGLNYAHRLDVVHGSLGPHNLWVRKDGTLVISDFGLPPIRHDICENLDELESKRLAYFAPEVLNEEPPGQMSDLFSAGVLFYQMLTGQRPFLGDDNQALAEAIRTESPDFSDLRHMGIPGGLVLLLEQLLAKDRAERCGNFDELLITLRSIRQFERDHPVEEPPRRKWTPRQYLSISILTILLLILWMIIADGR